ncbi:hypothetical protein PQ472_10470 [Lacticaseibacillus pabuli]|uniref:Uncharacterized protein n=1 Tax=Lacticaseibacillus pabuli TaxID=3025672 RepID=A0ABY7WQ27_9LACO|nr:hypothetical protein [Lacticaseibacillus sp. KACC 23028]WDF82303.1 hypothetical protein PQ472_10470 [Lacticaseibacillus sp. KACC 23028]
MPAKATRKRTQNARITKRTPRQKDHKLQRRLVTFLLALVVICGVGVVGLRATALNEDFTTQTLSTGDNLTQIESQIQKAAGSSLTNIPGASTIVSRTISEDTTKALVSAAVTDVYSNTTAQIDFTKMDAAVRSALTSSATGLAATLADSVANSLLPELHSYFNTQLANQTQEARNELQDLKSDVNAVIVPLVVIAAVLLIWLLLVAGGLGRFLHNVGWSGLIGGVAGLALTQVAMQLPQVTKLAAKAGDLQDVARSYMAAVVNHMSGYYLIAGGIGLALMLITIPLMRRR